LQDLRSSIFDGYAVATTFHAGSTENPNESARPVGCTSRPSWILLISIA
jgi:hypothetical protein